MSNTTNPVFDLDEQVAGQYQEAARWAAWLIVAGYPCELRGTGEPRPFHFEWIVFERVGDAAQGWHDERVASIDIDGCGASWHGPDELWLRVIRPHYDMIDY